MRLNNSWDKVLKKEFKKPYFINLRSILEDEYKKYIIYPKEDDIFNAYKLCPVEGIRAVIIGQDPYINEGEAHGLAFSVARGTNLPPSLKNIFKELENDLSIKVGEEGDLTAWAKSGVLLINKILTVRKDDSLSHKGYGWEIFTRNIIKYINTLNTPIVFILWGNNAKNLKNLMTNPKHLIIDAPHPSPQSSYRGFFGGRYFSKTNEFLIANEVNPINWQL